MSGLEDRNNELVESVDLMRETASKNSMKIAQVGNALMLERATSARLQQTLQGTREELSQSESSLAAAVGRSGERWKGCGPPTKQEIELKAMKEENSSHKTKITVEQKQ